MSQCRSCGAEIIWASTLAGKAMPLDAEPHVDGTFVLFNVDGKVARPVDPLFDPATPRYRSHFASCPQADEHRRPR